MSPEILIAFIAALDPAGPHARGDMALILASTLRRGLRAGLVTLAATTTGLADLVAAAALGMSSVMVFMSDGSTWCARSARFISCSSAPAALAVLAAPPQSAQPLPVSSRGSAYMQGLLVSLSNPKVLLFLGAFLPQFVDPAAIRCGSCRCWRCCSWSCWRLWTSAIRCGRQGPDHLRCGQAGLLDGAAGLLLLAGGIALAMVRRP